MDFFEHQSRAKSKSVKLYVLFSFVVLFISFLVFSLLSWFIERSDRLGDLAWSPFFLISTLWVVCFLIIGISLSKIKELSGGGWVVAKALGGELITSSSQNPLKRRILNIVEEMAIASGVQVPPVYLLKENSINAFAAGYSTEDAVIGVTIGCLEKLNREQLQGVMAHEFSHILNGDMRINIRMTGIIFGIVFIARAGQSIMDSHDDPFYPEEEGKSRWYLLGIGLYIIGILGAYLGAIIRSSVSRQREFLADASAVQFTRNAEGIVGALECIGGYSKGSRIWNPKSRQFCHMFFGPCMKNLMATHPPIEKRIRRIIPSWNKAFPNTNQISEGKIFEKNNFKRNSFTGNQFERRKPSKFEHTSVEGHKSRASSQKSIMHAQDLLKKIPRELTVQTQDSFGSNCLLFAMLLDPHHSIQKKQISLINHYTDSKISQHTQKIFPYLTSISCEEKLVLIEMAASKLSFLSPEQVKNFESVINMLIKEDKKFQLFEWSLLKLVNHKIKHIRTPNRQIHGRKQILSRLNECNIILSTLAHYGKDNEDPNLAYNVGFKHLSSNKKRKLINKKDCTFSKLDLAIDRLNDLNLRAKKKFLEACEITALHDKNICETETQIIRTVASSLGYPLYLLAKMN